MSTQLLACEDLSFRYSSYGSLQNGSIFSDLSFDITEGMMHLLLAEPEAGKSTLCRILCRMIPEYLGGALSGHITYGSATDLLDLPPNALLSKIGAVFQNPEEQLLMTTCEDEIQFPLENLGLPAEQIQDRVEDVLERYELLDYRDTNPSQLSGGEKKRLLLAVTDAVDPELWILDETFEELDEHWKTYVCEYLSGRGKTVLLMASRDHHIYQEYFTRCALLPSSGRIQWSEHAAVLEQFSDTAVEVLKNETPGEEICVLEELSYSYPQGNRGFSLSVDTLRLYRGEIAAFYGPNGSGKSTLSKLVCGLLSPQAGMIRFSSEGELLQVDGPQRMRMCGYLFQNPDFQIFLPTVEDELRYGLKMQDILKKDADAMIAHVLDIFDLGDPSQPPAVMSYGKRKRLQAAVYYLLDRKICILDEMDSGLSMKMFTHLLALLSAKFDTIVMITHDLQIAKSYAHRIIYLDSGRIQEVERICR